MNKNDSLKEYYVKLHELYNNAVNMLTAINQSLTTSASEVTIDVADTDDAHTQVRIPSFLYLENKLEQLDMNFNALFNMPESGEAWFSKASNMFKLQMVKSNSAPLTPTFTETNNAYSRTNWLLKDMVSPKTYLKLYIDNLPDNIEQMYMKKIVVYDVNVFNRLKLNSNLKSYASIKEALFNYNQGSDYEEYEKILDLPIKQDEFKSEFKIMSIPHLESGNPYTSLTLSENGHTHLEYKIVLDTIRYTNQEDDAQEFELKTGDYISLMNQNCVYKVKSVNITKNEYNETENHVIIEEYIGHQALQTFDENQNMVFELYNNDYTKYHYVEVPLEENPYIIVFLGTLYNNVRSNLSDAYIINLNEIYMKDDNGNDIYDGNSTKPMTYIQYYKKYCKNIGDLILGLTETAYPQISNYYNEQLGSLTMGSDVKRMVDSTIDQSTLLKVTRINSHLIDDETTKKVLKLHAQKNTLNSQLTTVQDNIDQIYNTMMNTDFQQEINITQESLRSKLNEYYNERISLQAQQISVIDNINSLRHDAKGTMESKYRIRGVLDTQLLIDYLHNIYDDTCDVIGTEIEYKYKSSTSDPKVTDTDSVIFTDWVKQPTIERERYIDFDSSNNSYEIKFVDYSTTSNIIRWNQIDIPITQGEEVQIRVRYRYNIGQPFMNLYTPWSDSVTVSFPEELEETIELRNVFATNDDDTVSAKFNKTLINEGYEEHISNKIIDSSQVFFHQPENIYSGFNTSENKLISLKDKLNAMSNEIEEYKTLINTELNAKYTVYLVIDGEKYEIHDNTDNNIIVNDANIDNDKFIRKNMSIIINNNGDVPINLYSIFPGNIETPLIAVNGDYYFDYAYDKIDNYDRVPVLYGNSQDQNENMMLQTFGQWIYFRNNNPYTAEMIYMNDDTQNASDRNNIKENNQLTWNIDYNEYLATDKQPQYAQNVRTFDNDTHWCLLKYDVSTGTYTTRDYENVVSEYDPQNFKYHIGTDNKYVLKYEHIFINENETKIYLSEKDSLSSFCSRGNLNKSDLNGAVLIPQLNNNTQLLCNSKQQLKNQFYKLDVGKTVTIPVIYEYYIDGSTIERTHKSLCFDIKTSLMQPPVNYVINITSEYISTNTKYDYSNFVSLNDKLIKE